MSDGESFGIISIVVDDVACPQTRIGRGLRDSNSNTGYSNLEPFKLKFTSRLRFKWNAEDDRKRF